jgi:hypothetical protein
MQSLANPFLDPLTAGLPPRLEGIVTLNQFPATEVCELANAPDAALRAWFPELWDNVPREDQGIDEYYAAEHVAAQRMLLTLVRGMALLVVGIGLGVLYAKGLL